MLLDPDTRHQLERLTLHLRGRVRGKWSGRHASYQLGDSVDFADYREYVPGDDYRRIDHNLAARLGVVMIRLFEAEDEFPIRLVLDTSASMRHHAKFEAARRIAAVVAYLALSGGDRVYPIQVPGADGRPFLAGPPSRHRSAWPQLEAWLESLDPANPGQLQPVGSHVASSLALRGATVVISDLLDDTWEAAIDAIGAAGSGLVLHVLGRAELEPDLSGDLRLVDSESGKVVDLSTSSDALAAYERALDSFLAATTARSRRAGLDYVLVPSDTEVVGHVLRALAATATVR
jgi:uncharacterized protein (DUF58 family)